MGFRSLSRLEYDAIQNQLSQQKGEASLEVVFLKQRELATDFSFSTAIAIIYSFGSQYANIINTRF